MQAPQRREAHRRMRFRGSAAAVLLAALAWWAFLLLLSAASWFLARGVPPT